MNARMSSLNIVTIIVPLAMVLAMTTSIMTKQAFASEDPKNCNTDDGALVTT
jgi:hypothetical protein